MARLAVRLAGELFFFEWLEMVSLLPVLAGVALLLGGRPALRWSCPSIGFLVFMFPQLHRVETGPSRPLQAVANRISTCALPTVGLPTFAEGNVIFVNEASVGVVEACNGPGMLILFFALATTGAIPVRKPLLDKLVIVASAVPIAVLANVVRIVANSVLLEVAGRRWADLVFHDLARWLIFLWPWACSGSSSRLLSCLLVDVPAEPRGRACYHGPGPLVLARGSEVSLPAP